MYDFHHKREGDTDCACGDVGEGGRERERQREREDVKMICADVRMRSCEGGCKDDMCRCEDVKMPYVDVEM